MLRAAVAALPLVLVTSLAVAVTPPRPDVTGSYHSNWDDVKLVQDGDRIHGTYVCCGGGTIEGRVIEDRVVRYVWRQPGGSGMGVWTIEAGRLVGTWGIGQSESDGGRWDLTRVRHQIAN